MRTVAVRVPTTLDTAMTPHPPKQQPLDLEGEANRSRALRWALTGATPSGDAASAVYGTILAASLIIAVSGAPWTVIITVVGSGIVFWLAHAHVGLMRKVIREGRHVGAGDVIHTLKEEWPLVQASLTPATPFLLAAFGLINLGLARWLGVAICFIGLAAWGIVVARAGRLSLRMTALAVGINVGLGLMLVLLKIIVQ